MEYIECPAKYNGSKKNIFQGGGISNCPNWQADIAHLLKYEDLVFINPRRSNFDINNLSMTKQQIVWEHNYLRKSTGIVFWFPQETICPITLYELGAWSITDKPLFFGVHPNYARSKDVRIQTELVRPDVNVVYDLKGLAKQVKEWSK